MKKIILASASPWRQELLANIGLQFEVEPSHLEEVVDPALSPRDLAKSLSLAKAKLVAKNHPDALIIAADTFGVLKGKLLGKPHTPAEARRMLQALSGKSHSVITGFTIIDTQTNRVVSKAVETKVYIKKLTPDEIDAYVKSGESLDKAGAYAIQGLGAVIVDKIEGDYFNVIGLPLSVLAESLKEFGVQVLSAADSPAT